MRPNQFKYQENGMEAKGYICIYTVGCHERNHNFIDKKRRKAQSPLAVLVPTCTPLRLFIVHTHTSPRRHLRSGFWSMDLLSLRARPFSTSSGRSRGVGGTSSSLVRPRRLERVEPLTERGNSDRLGVSAMATFFADLLMVSLMVHSRFLAMKKRVAVETGKRQHY